MQRSTDLSHRSDAKELPPASGTLFPSCELLNADSGAAAWRLVECFSERGLPFELVLRWSGGAGSGAHARMTVAHASRVCVFARSLTIQAINLTITPNRVGVTVADGFAPTANVWEQRTSCDGVSPVALSVPPFALSFQVQLADRTALPRTSISIFDGLGALQSQLFGLNQPGIATPVGGAGRIDVLTGGATNLRAIFQLSI